MKELLEKIYSNYSLAILTNEGKEWADRKIDNQKIRYLFKKIIISAELHELKPAKEFYLKALKILDVKPEECIFIDDQKKNCEAAEKLGIKSIIFENPTQLKKELATFSINVD
jgi:HAD superfamily hydrolase (TIGR01509 family)